MLILVAGEALIDVVERDGEEVARVPGGSPFNVAVGLGRLMVPTAFAGQIGYDLGGQRVREKLAQAHVEFHAREPVLTRTCEAIARIGPDGTAQYTFDLAWAPASLPDPDSYEAVHVGSIGAWLEPGATRVLELATSAAAGGIPVSFDANVRLTAGADPGSWRAAAERLLPHASIVKLSDEDAAVIFPGSGIDAVIEKLRRPGRLVAVTLGSAGAVIASSHCVVRLPASRVDVIDTIGAGDSFMAALLAAVRRRAWVMPSDEAGLREVGDFAARAAAVAVSRAGAEPPWLTELSTAGPDAPP